MNHFSKKGLNAFLKRVTLNVLTLVFFMHWSVHANANTGLRYQPIAGIKVAVHDFLTQQAEGLPGRTNVEVGNIDPNLRLMACGDLRAFLPTGSRAWGRTTVGVRCIGQAKWTIYVQAQVQVHGAYVVTAAPLHQGKVVAMEDLAVVTGDLTKMPAGVFTTTEEAVGRIVKMSIPAGTVLRENSLKIAPVIQRGQTVVVTSAGKNFKVAAEGKALGDAITGQVVQVKVASGQVIAGVAKASGHIEVSF